MVWKCASYWYINALNHRSRSGRIRSGIGELWFTPLTAFSIATVIGYRITFSNLSELTVQNATHMYLTYVLLLRLGDGNLKKKTWSSIVTHNFLFIFYLHTTLGKGNLSPSQRKQGLIWSVEFITFCQGHSNKRPARTLMSMNQDTVMDQHSRMPAIRLF